MHDLLRLHPDDRFYLQLVTNQVNLMWLQCEAEDSEDLASTGEMIPSVLVHPTHHVHHHSMSTILLPWKRTELWVVDLPHHLGLVTICTAPKSQEVGVAGAVAIEAEEDFPVSVAALIFSNHDARPFGLVQAVPVLRRRLHPQPSGTILIFIHQWLKYVLLPVFSLLIVSGPTPLARSDTVRRQIRPHQPVVRDTRERFHAKTKSLSRNSERREECLYRKTLSVTKMNVNKM